MGANVPSDPEDRRFIMGYNNTFGPRVENPPAIEPPEKWNGLKTAAELAMEKARYVSVLPPLDKMIQSLIGPPLKSTYELAAEYVLIRMERKNTLVDGYYQGSSGAFDRFDEKDIQELRKFVHKEPAWLPDNLARMIREEEVWLKANFPDVGEAVGSLRGPEKAQKITVYPPFNVTVDPRVPPNTVFLHNQTGIVSTITNIDPVEGSITVSSKPAKQKKTEKVAEKPVVPDLAQMYLRRIAGYGAK